MHRTSRHTLAVLVLAGVALAASAAELTTQKSSERGVTVAVTPQKLSPDAPAWEFKVVIDTHSADLNDDLAKSSVLIDGSGAQHAPVAWEGAGPGGHHREGVLRFKPVSPGPRSIELQIRRAGETGPRSFRWELD